jgi:hypothetical protein
MKSTLTFNLPEEKEELNDALNGGKYKAALDTLYDDVFRPHLKYGNPIIGDAVLTDEQYAIIEALWKKVAEHLEDVL